MAQAEDWTQLADSKSEWDEKTYEMEIKRRNGTHSKHEQQENKGLLK